LGKPGGERVFDFCLARGREGRLPGLRWRDREARKQGVTAAERLMFRREHAREWLKEIQRECRILSNGFCRIARWALNMWT